MRTTTPHLWQGEWIGDQELERRLEDLGRYLEPALGQSLPTSLVLNACAALAQELTGETRCGRELARILSVDHGLTAAEITAQLAELSTFLARPHLEQKLRRELQSTDPLDPTRIDFRGGVFECYAPLGVLVHIAPTNAIAVAALSVVEGLLTGNVNILKTGGKDSLFAQHLLFTLGELAPASLRQHIIAARISSKQQGHLQRLLQHADGVCVWGSEEAVQSIKRMTPDGARFIDWGPKISFAYLAASHQADAPTIARLAEEIVLVEQQACSSPQVVYLEWTGAATPELLRPFAERLATALQHCSTTKKPPSLAQDDQAEITNVVEVTRLEEHLGLTQVLEGVDQAFRILIDQRSALRSSPLHRTIWVKPMARAHLVATLRPMRSYLQTVGLACARSDYADIAQRLVAAGALRITAIGAMTESYMGEPHDGVYALQRYAKRVSLQPGPAFDGVASFSQLRGGAGEPLPTGEVLTKAGFQAAIVADAYSDLFFKSGGSSGEPKVSIFTYDDYHQHMQLASRGLYAAGLRPGVDRCMNLFYAGALYGGFISFFTVLENLRAAHLPMGAYPDLAEVARAIVRHKVTVLLGMPSYLLQLFQQHGEALRAYGGVQKIFFGGEHLTTVQRRFLHDGFGISLIKSATYGSVDAGPLGYQCAACAGTVHHLHSRLHALEILQLEADQPVAPGEAGRLIFSSKVRSGQRLTRYEIGDVGRWVQGDCACGLTEARFELLGRHGDVIRVATNFLNYRRFVATLGEAFNYAGNVQLVLTASQGMEAIEVLVDLTAPEPEAVRAALLAADADLSEVVVHDKLLHLSVRRVLPEGMRRNPTSGKLPGVVDLRQALGEEPK